MHCCGSTSPFWLPRSTYFIKATLWKEDIIASFTITASLSLLWPAVFVGCYYYYDWQQKLLLNSQPHGMVLIPYRILLAGSKKDGATLKSWSNTCKTLFSYQVDWYHAASVCLNRPHTASEPKTTARRNLHSPSMEVTWRRKCQLS